jgi:hypothetical protein
MSTHTEKILAVIKQTAGIHAAKIADLLACDLDDVLALLPKLVMSGQVLMSNIDLLHHERKVIGYSINPAYLGWGTSGKSVHIELEKERTIEKAVLHLREIGRSANGTELSIAMGLDTTRYKASQFLSPAIKSGRIVRDGNLYRLGCAAASVAGLFE